MRARQVKEWLLLSPPMQRQRRPSAMTPAAATQESYPWRGYPVLTLSRRRPTLRASARLPGGPVVAAMGRERSNPGRWPKSIPETRTMIGGSGPSSREGRRVPSARKAEVADKKEVGIRNRVKARGGMRLCGWQTGASSNTSSTPPFVVRTEPLVCRWIVLRYETDGAKGSSTKEDGEQRRSSGAQTHPFRLIHFFISFEADLKLNAPERVHSKHCNSLFCQHTAQSMSRWN